MPDERDQDQERRRQASTGDASDARRETKSSEIARVGRAQTSGGGTGRVSRIQTATERDFESLRARDERERERSARHRMPEFVAEEITGQYEGDELRVARSKRSTGERLERLEEKHDSLVQDVTETRMMVSEIRGELKVMPKLVEMVAEVAQRAAQREHVTFTAQVDVDKAKALDQIDAKKTTRGRVTTIIGGAVAAASSGAFLHWLMGRL